MNPGAWLNLARRLFKEELAQTEDKKKLSQQLGCHDGRTRSGSQADLYFITFNLILNG